MSHQQFHLPQLFGIRTLLSIFALVPRLSQSPSLIWALVPDFSLGCFLHTNPPGSHKSHGLTISHCTWNYTTSSHAPVCTLAPSSLLRCVSFLPSSGCLLCWVGHGVLLLSAHQASAGRGSPSQRIHCDHPRCKITFWPVTLCPSPSLVLFASCALCNLGYFAWLCTWVCRAGHRLTLFTLCP